MPKAALRALLCTLLLTGALATPAFASEPHSGPFADNHVTAELVADTKTVQPGTTVQVGVKFVIEADWHVYWLHPGEAGLPVKYTWTLPEGWSASDILWPTPVRSEHMGSASYGYEGTFVLPVELQVPATAPEGKVRIIVDPSWQVCYEQCILDECPALALDLVVSRAAPEAGAHHADFETARKLRPGPLPAAAKAAVKAVEKGLELRLEGAGPWLEPDSSLFLFQLAEKVGGKLKDVVSPSAPQPVKRDGNVVVLSLPFPKARKAPPARLQGVLSVHAAAGRVGFALDLPVEGAPAAPVAAPGSPTGTGSTEPPKEEPKPPAGASKPPAPVAAELPPEEDPLSLGLAILLAFIGGVILNLMPCVLPVLSIKILGFVSQGGEDPTTVRRHGYAFAFGVLVSFWLLAGVIEAIKAGGEGVGWGFQLQHPVVNAILATVMLAVGLNLFGVFEVGTSVMGLAGDAAGKIHAGGYAGSFWSGVLATAIATPCTAPFMAGAVGFAIKADTVPAFLVFTSLALGMAAPYVVLTASPRLLKKVPRPGPWMETFKRVLAFPMVFVAVWLVGVVGKQTNLEGVKLVLFGLVAISLGLWIYGHWGTLERSVRVRRVLGYGLALVCILFGGYLGWLGCQEKPPAIEDSDEVGDISALPAPNGEWWPWTPKKVNQYRAAGYVCFVDFTADWCAVCKVNEHAFLDNDEFFDAVKKYEVALFKADFTSEDDTILKYLKSWGLAGVPAYVTYSPRLDEKPVVRSAITTGIVVNDLTKAHVPRTRVAVLPSPSNPPTEPATNGK